VCDLLDRQIRVRPEAIAVHTPAQSWTYSDLHRMTARLSDQLRHRGARRGTFVALLAPLSPAALIGLLATMRSGAACLPLEPDDPPGRLNQVLEESGCDLVLLAGRHIPVRPDAIRIDESCLADGDEVPTAPRGPSPPDLAYAITTSGSTGRPKVVAVPHDALFNLIVASIDDFSLTAERDVVLWLSRPTVDVTMQDCLMALCSGATLAIPGHDDFPPGAILTAARALGATVVDIPAAVVGPYGKSLLRRLARAGVRLVITGGSRLDGAGLAGAPGSLVVYNAYGPTEAAVTATLYKCTGSTPRWPPIGRPIRGVRAYILDDLLSPVPVGTAGQLYLAGKGLAWGYIGAPGRTASVFLPDPFAREPGQRMYATGDRVRMRTDGNIEFLDRVDNQVKISGFRIEVGEVEHFLQECPGIREAAVVVREDIPGGAALAAFLVGSRNDAAAVDTRLRDHLPHHMIPKLYIWLETMPLNRQAKIDRKWLATFPIEKTAAMVRP
jgi:amino acid adenylation domain-containing protein